MQQQLPLAVSLDADATFSNFMLTDSGRAEVVALLTAGEKQVLLWGAEGSGRSHLLQAACHHWQGQYLPLSELAIYPPPMVLEGLENLPLIALDQLDAVIGLPHWEEALFHLYNRCLNTRARLLFAADSAPSQLTIELADLSSRLAAGVVLHLSPYSDSNKVAILQSRAGQLGLQLSDSVAQFLLRRAPRSLAQLVAVLAVLDQRSLAEQRQLSIPFVKAALGL